VSAGDASGKALVLISGTIDSAMLGNKLRLVNVPVISLEPNIMDEMSMSSSSGTAGQQTQITIVDPAHPLAGDLQGTVTVYSSPASIVFGSPASGAQVVATVVGSSARAAIYGYPPGAALVGGTPAPAKRIAFFANDNQAGLSLSAAGFTLFDAAVAWALTP
jgi:hypothetical protein